MAAPTDLCPLTVGVVFTRGSAYARFADPVAEAIGLLGADSRFNTYPGAATSLSTDTPLIGLATLLRTVCR